MYYAIEGDSAFKDNSYMFRMLKMFKGARALRIVGRALKMYEAEQKKRELDAELKKQAEVMGNELATTMQLLTENGVGELLYTMIDTAGDGADEADLAEHSYNLAMLLLSMPHNKELYESLQECGKSGRGSGKQYFADRVIWDTSIFAVNGAAQAQAKQTSIEKYDRANTEAAAVQRGIERVKEQQRGEHKIDDEAFDELSGEAERMLEKLTLPELAESWLDGLVQRHTAADQHLIAAAIDEASNKGVPETSRAVSTAKAALLELRYPPCHFRYCCSSNSDAPLYCVSTGMESFAHVVRQQVQCSQRLSQTESGVFSTPRRTLSTSCQRSYQQNQTF